MSYGRPVKFPFKRLLTVLSDRYIALQNDSVGEGPLQKYFLGEKMVSPLGAMTLINKLTRLFQQHGADADIFTANMYLAEDRVRPILI